MIRCGFLLLAGVACPLAFAADNALTPQEQKDHGSPCWFRNIKLRPLR
jgi:hypothetical protein